MRGRESLALESLVRRTDPSPPERGSPGRGLLEQDWQERGLPGPVLPVPQTDRSLPESQVQVSPGLASPPQVFPEQASRASRPREPVLRQTDQPLERGSPELGRQKDRPQGPLVVPQALEPPRRTDRLLDRQRGLRQTDRPPGRRDRLELRGRYVQCRPELHALAAVPCGASRLRFHELVHSGAAWRLAGFGIARRAPWRDIFRALIACCLAHVPDCGRRDRSRSCRWLRDRPLFGNRLAPRVHGPASGTTSRGNSKRGDRRSRH